MSDDLMCRVFLTGTRSFAAAGVRCVLDAQARQELRATLNSMTPRYLPVTDRQIHLCPITGQ
jgi:hypothetical protein